MGKAGDWVRKCARDAVTAQLQNMALRVSQQTPFITVGCLNSDQTKVTLADGSSWNVVLSGNIAGRCGPVTRMNSNTYYMVGQNLKTFQLDGGNDGYFIAGWYPMGSVQTPTFTEGHTFTVQYATSFPTLTVFNIKNQTNYFQIPQDPSFRVFQPYTNQDFILGANGVGVSLPPPGDNATDGVFYAALKPGAGEIAILRVNSYGGIQETPVGVTPFASPIDLDWTVLTGVGFNGTSNSVTWKTVINGSRTLAFPGRFADITDLPFYPSRAPFIQVNNTQSFLIKPFLYWTQDGSFDFDAVGNFASAVSAKDRDFQFENALLEGFAYVQGVVSGGAVLGSYDRRLTTDIFPHDVYASTNTRSRSLFNNTKGGTSNVLQINNNFDIFYCSPYGNQIEDLTVDFGLPPGEVPSSVLRRTFDTFRTYDLSPLPGFITPIASTTVDIKTTADESFTTISVLSTGSTNTVTVTNYSWESSDSSFKKGKVITGKALPAAPDSSDGSPGQVGTIMDWIIK